MFQKKVIIPEPTPLSEKEIKNLKEKLNEKEDLVDLKIKDIKINELIPQSFNGTIVSVIDHRHALYLQDGMDGAKFKTFRKSSGGIFSKDVLNYTRNKKHGKYVLIEGNGERKIVRLIKDEEILLFQTRRLINGIVKDTPYMILKKLKENEKYVSTSRYIKEKDRENETVEEEVIIIIPSPKIEDDHETNTTSISLFDE